MSVEQSSSTAPIGRFTALVLGCVVFACVTLIGCAGYLKYQLDKAQNQLAAPSLVMNSEIEPLDRLRRILSYGGFLGTATGYASTHDAARVTDLRNQIKAARDGLTHLPEKTSAETRRDLNVILDMYGHVLEKAEKSSTDPATSFTEADLQPLYAALPILETRIANAESVARVGAQGDVQLWSMLLTLTSWCSLVIAAALAAAIYLTLHKRNGAPMRALAQSVRNMARGDMRTPIWGMERTDTVGELARAVDLARYQFSQLPDMSLISDQGPVRMRFEGSTRSLFDALMQVLTRDSDQIKTLASGLAESIAKQQEAIGRISTRVESVLRDILERGQDGHQQLKKAIGEMVGSADNLRNAHAHAADQITRLVPYLQERAQGMAEITQITGKQATQALQSLIATERGLNANAAESQEAAHKLSSIANDLSERLFAAVNLMQASGKILSETTETTQSRLNEAVNLLMKSEDYLRQLAQSPNSRAMTIEHEPSPALSTEKIEIALSAITSTLNAIEDRMSGLEQRSHEHDHIALPQTEPPSSFVVDTSHIGQAMSDMASTLAEIDKKLSGLPVSQNAPDVQDIRDIVQQPYSEIISAFDSKLTSLREIVAETVTAALLGLTPPSVEDDQHKKEEMQEMLTQVLEASRQTMIASVSETIASIHAANPAESIGPEIESLKRDVQSSIAAISEKTSAQYDSLRQPIEQLSEKIPQQIALLMAQIEESRHVISMLQTEFMQSRETKADPTTDITTQLRDHWYQMAAQIEATRSSLAQTIAEHMDKVETRLAGNNAPAPTSLSNDARTRLDQQTMILSELVATLGALDEHVQDIKKQVWRERL